MGLMTQVGFIRNAVFAKGAIMIKNALVCGAICLALPIGMAGFAKGSVIKAGISGDEGSLDPATGTTAAPQYPIKHAYNGLFSFDTQGKLKNEMCKSYKLSPDGKTYTFTLRGDAKWSDGKPVTAKDFVYGFQRNLVPDLKASYADMMNAIVNFDDCIKGAKPMADFGVKAIGNTTLEVKLSRPQPYFPQMTTFSPFFPVREDKVPRNSSKWSTVNVKDVVTNGPYKFEFYNANEKVVLVRNPYYFNAKAVKIDRIEFYFIPDAQTQVAAFKTGEIDLALVPPTDINTTYPNKAEVKEVPYLVNGVYVVSARNKFLQDVRVREAISIAINRKRVADILGGINKPLYGLVPCGITNPATGKDFRTEGGNLVKEDVARARKLLEEAGYPGGKGLPEFVWLNNNSKINTDIAQVVQGMLKQIGVNITLKLLDSSTFSAERRAGNFDIARLSTSADYVDPTTWLNLCVSDSAYIKRVAAYSTPKYDQLVADSDKLLDPRKRFAKLHEAEAELMGQYWWIPMVNANNQMLQKNYVKDIYTTTAGDVYLTYATVTK